MTFTKLLALAPILILSMTIILLVLHASVKRNHQHAWFISAIGLIASLWGAGYASGFSQQVTVLLEVDNWGLLFSALLIVSTLVTIAVSRDSFMSEGERKEEYYLLILLSTLGAIVLCQSSHVVSLLLGMELMGIAVYAMIAFPEEGLLPLEAGIKYLVLSACASAMLLFGFALLYAATGELSYSGIGAKTGTAFANNPLIVVTGTAMVLAGMGFKLSVVPFHMWTPDVYEGAPTPVTNYLATVSKGAVFVALTRLFIEGEFFRYPSLIMALTLVSILSMLVGNLLALRQNNIKRLLAYSSIAHFGYLLMVLVGFSSLQVVDGLHFGREAITFYLLAYILTTLAALVVVANVAGEETADIELFSGLFWKRPIQAAALSVAMLSFAGIPLTAGFMGKFYLITVGINAGLWLLVVALILGSAIAIYYYLRLIFAMSATQNSNGNEYVTISLGWRDTLAFFLLAAVLFVGSWPQPFIDIAGI